MKYAINIEKVGSVSLEVTKSPIRRKNKFFEKNDNFGTKKLTLFV